MDGKKHKEIPGFKKALNYGGACMLKASISSLRESLPKTAPLRFGSENQFPLNFATNIS